MNIYQVVSEVLTEAYETLALDPPEQYRIVELVVARKRSQAGLMAWKNDRGYEICGGYMPDKPKMSIRIVKKGVDGPARIVTQEPECQELWKE